MHLKATHMSQLPKMWAPVRRYIKPAEKLGQSASTVNNHRAAKTLKKTMQLIQKCGKDENKINTKKDIYIISHPLARKLAENYRVTTQRQTKKEKKNGQYDNINDRRQRPSGGVLILIRKNTLQSKAKVNTFLHATAVSVS